MLAEAQRWTEHQYSGALSVVRPCGGGWARRSRELPHGPGGWRAGGRRRPPSRQGLWPELERRGTPVPEAGPASEHCGAPAAPRPWAFARAASCQKCPFPLKHLPVRAPPPSPGRKLRPVRAGTGRLAPHQGRRGRGRRGPGSGPWATACSAPAPQASCLQNGLTNPTWTPLGHEHSRGGFGESCRWGHRGPESS